MNTDVLSLLKGLLGSYQIRYYNPLFIFGRTDVPPERLYKDMQLAEKGGIKPGFGISF